MRFSSLSRIFLLLALCGFAAFAHAAPRELKLPILDQPPANVGHWVEIIWGAPMNHPVMPVYFITENRRAPEDVLAKYVVMKPQEYDAVVRFTHASRCSPVRIMAMPPYPLTIEVDEFSGKEVRDVCVFPRYSGCRYLFGLANLHDVDWSNKDTWPIFRFEAELGCKGPLTPSHDATGRSE